MLSFKNKNILCVIAHPDDETIGCGAFLHNLVVEGASIQVLLLLKSNGKRGKQHWNKYLKSFKRACSILGVEAVISKQMFSEELAEQYLWKINDIIEPYVQSADFILTHHPNDVHQSHRIISRSVEIITRPFRFNKCVIFFEVSTSTDQGYDNLFAPNMFVSLSEEDVRIKLLAMECYETEYAIGRRPEDLLLKLKFRGSQIGTKYSEFYQIARLYI